MTPHEINNVISRAWVQHKKGVYDPFDTDQYKKQVAELKYKIIEELNQEMYEKEKETIDFIKGKPIKALFIYTRRTFSITNKYPLTINDVYYDRSFDNILKSDERFKKLVDETQVRVDKLTTDRGFFYVQSMLLYEKSMTNEQFYNTIRGFFTLK